MRAAWLAVVLTAAAGCGTGARDCTQIGAEPQVVLRTDAAPPVGAVAQVCLDDDCTAEPWRDGQAYVPVPELPRDGSVELRLRTLTAGGEVVDEGRLTAEVRTFRPNGPGCEPAVGQVLVRRGADGGYEQASR